MRLRIIIDTDEADEAAAIDTDTPFTLRLYRDGDDNTTSQVPLTLGNEMAIIGNDIPKMLDRLAKWWMLDGVLDEDGKPVLRTGEQWRGATTAQTSGPAETVLPECPRHGGPWGSDETCQMCVDVDGNMRPTPSVCDECSQPATCFWRALTPPVQLCDSCAHNAMRSGWQPGV